MILGPFYVYKCPSCGKLIRIESIRSGNTIGSIQYSDGKVDAPMLPDFPDLIQCNNCHTFFWLSKLKYLTTQNRQEVENSREWVQDKPRIVDINGSFDDRYYESEEFTRAGNLHLAKVADAQFLDIDGYFQALKEGLAENRQEEIFIRSQIWWQYNAIGRSGKPRFADAADEARWRENCNILMTLFDPDDLDQRILVAELKRNTGDFEGCAELLHTVTDENYKWLTEKILHECEQKNPLTIPLNSGF